MRVTNKKKVKGRKQVSWSKVAFRNALTNGSSLFLDRHLDQRSTFVRRYRDLITEHTESLGGADNLGAGEKAVLRRACMLLVQIERLECEFAKADGVVSNKQLEIYQRLTNTTRRTLESLGLQRRQRDVTPPSVKDYVAHINAQEPAE